MIKFHLKTRFYQCPVYWQNFINSIQEYLYEDVPINRIQCELKKYNARYRFSGSSPYDCIQFNSEKDLLFFILRFS